MDLIDLKQSTDGPTVDFENRFPHGYTRFVSRPVPETTLIRIGLLYKQPLLSRIASQNVVTGFQRPMSYCKIPEISIEGSRQDFEGVGGDLAIWLVLRPPSSLTSFSSVLSVVLSVYIYVVYDDRRAAAVE